MHIGGFNTGTHLNTGRTYTYTHNMHTHASPHTHTHTHTHIHTHMHTHIHTHTQEALALPPLTPQSQPLLPALRAVAEAKEQREDDSSSLSKPLRLVVQMAREAVREEEVGVAHVCVRVCVCEGGCCCVHLCGFGYLRGCVMWCVSMCRGCVCIVWVKNDGCVCWRV